MYRFQSVVLQQQNGLDMNRGEVVRHAAVAALLVIGSVLLVRGVLPVLMHWTYNYSEPVRAQVVDSRFEEVTRWPGIVRSRPVFSYRYLHQGLLFQGTAYRPAGKQSEAVRRYVPGLVIDVFVDPDRPSRAMVRPGTMSSDLAQPVFGLFLLVLGSVLLARRLGCPVSGSRA